MPPEACLWRSKLVFQPAKGRVALGHSLCRRHGWSRHMQAGQAGARDISLSPEQDNLDRDSMPEVENCLRRRGS